MNYAEKVMLDLIVSLEHIKNAKAPKSNLVINNMDLVANNMNRKGIKLITSETNKMSLRSLKIFRKFCRKLRQYDQIKEKLSEINALIKAKPRKYIT